MRLSVAFSLHIPYISKFFHPTENLTYPYRISTQRVARSSYILNLKNKRLNLGHCKYIRDINILLGFSPTIISLNPLWIKPAQETTLMCAR